MPSNGPNAGVTHGVFGRSICLIHSGIVLRSRSILSSSFTSLGSCGMQRPPVVGIMKSKTSVQIKIVDEQQWGAASCPLRVTDRRRSMSAATAAFPGSRHCAPSARWEHDVASSKWEGRAMNLSRHPFLQLAAGAVALPAISRTAWAQSYPTRPVRISVGFPAGGGADITARLMGQWLSERLGRPFIIENRPGAGTTIGTEAVVRAPADGYTLLLVNANNAINATLYDRLNFNFIRDIAPVAAIMRVPNVIVVNPSVPVKTVPEFIAY